MENPATWGRAERAVAEALRRAEMAHSEGRVGLSRVRMITDALREEGIIPKDES